MARKLSPKPAMCRKAWGWARLPRMGTVASTQGAYGFVGVDALEVDDLDAEDGEHRARVRVGQPVRDDRIHDEQQRQLEQERQAARQRVDPALLEQLLLGEPRLDLVALEALLDLLELRLDELHPALGDQLLAVERDQDRPHDQGEDDDPPRDRERRPEVLEELVGPRA